MSLVKRRLTIPAYLNILFVVASNPGGISVVDIQRVTGIRGYNSVCKVVNDLVRIGALQKRKEGRKSYIDLSSDDAHNSGTLIDMDGYVFELQRRMKEARL